MDISDSLRLALDAEKHAHLKDNQYLWGMIDELRAALNAARTLLDCYAFQGDKVAGMAAQKIAEILNPGLDVKVPRTD